MALFASGKGLRPGLTTGCWLGLALFGSLTYSQYVAAAGAAPIEEILVTARKKEERLIDVPAALTSLNEESLDKYMTREITQISQLVPGLDISYSSTGQGGLLTLRGLGSDVDAGVENVVALNFDGIQVNNGRMLRVAMFDLESVQVLKGPQALFFGKNSPGGLVAFNSASPGDVREGYLRVGAADKTGKRYVEGAITLPVNDTLSTRLAMRYDSEDGFLDNNGGPLLNPFSCLPQPGPCVNPVTRGPIQGDTRDWDSLFGRLSVAWKPNDQFDALFKFTAGKFEDNGDVANIQRVCNGEHPIVTSGGITAVDTNADCKVDYNTTIGTWPAELAAKWPEQKKGGKPFSEFEPILTSLNANYHWDQYTLTSVTGYYDYDAPNQGNSDVNTFTILGGSNSAKGDGFSQEFRLASAFGGPFNFLAGVYYENAYHRYTNNGKILPQASFFKVDLGNGKGYDSRSGRSNDWLQYSESDSKTYSVFGQIIWDLSDQMTLEAGARYLKDKRDVSVSNKFVNDSIIAPVRAAVFLPEGTVLATKLKDDDFSPEITISYRPAENMTLYASYKSGFQSGGMSNPGLPPPLPGPEALTFLPTEADGFELGFKFGFADVVTGDVIFYDYEFKNLQVQSSRVVEVLPGVETVLYTITNAADAYTRGVEVQGVWQTPLEGLTALTIVQYNKAKYKKYPGAPCYSGGAAAGLCDASVGVDLSGARLERSPKWDMRLGLNYENQVSPDLLFSASVAANFEDDIYFDQPASPLIDLPRYGVVDSKRESFWSWDASARLTWREKYELALIGTNLGGKLWLEGAGSPLASGGAAAGDFAVAVSQPRTLTLQLTVNFD